MAVNRKSYKGEVICKCGDTMKAVGWSAHEGHIWICPSCGNKKFEFYPNKIIYSDTSAPKGRKKREKKKTV